MNEDVATPANQSILQKEKDGPKYVKYRKLEELAKREGRIDGEFRCLSCGMHYLTFDEAHNCCRLPANES